MSRRYAVGAEWQPPAGTSFRLWAPDRGTVSVVVEGDGEYPLERDSDGYFSALIDVARPGTRYRFRLDGKDELLSDPASRFQPEGLDGPSEVTDGQAFRWTDDDWHGLSHKGQVLYEMHIGTFTHEGTWSAALEHLPKLNLLGITAIELLPVAEFQGSFGWGYDSVLQYAPSRLYGAPDDFKRFVNDAHKLGIGVLIDVVYNHFGAGDRFEEFTPQYFRTGAPEEWGRPVNFDPVTGSGAREYFVENVEYWVEEFHVDGFRIDAAHALSDQSDEHIIAEIVRRARRVAGDRGLFIISEDEPQQAHLARAPERHGFGVDAIWNEDFHHVAMVTATGRKEAYQHDHSGTPQELIATAKYGFLFQGQRYDWQDKARGTNARDLGPEQFVHYLQNHDQVANTATGGRFWQRVSPARARTLTTLFLLMPQTPMLFQGQEFAASTPFFYFLDRHGDLAAKVKEGRDQFLQQFPSLRDRRVEQRLPPPHDRATFERCKLNWTDYDRNESVVTLHHDLIAMRRTVPAFVRQPSAVKGELDGAVIAAEALILRYYDDRGSDRLLAVNLGPDLPVRSIADPLTAPPDGKEWFLEWSSEVPRYGGEGQREIDMTQRWTFPSETALIFALRPARPPKPFDKRAETERQRMIF
jgi:maltooligosyltrehalose trehalohydrolase